MSSIRVSPRILGKMNTPEFCARCFWFLILVGFYAPFAFPMPGIMHNLDRFEKRLVEAYFARKGVLPRWLSKLGCTEIVEFPAKMTMEFPKHCLTLVGMPDAVFRKEDGTLYLVDYKTARFKGDADPFMPVYETQLLGYAELLENEGLGDVTSAALIYFENQLSAYSENALSLLSADGFTVPMAAKIHPVELDRKSLESLLKDFRDYADLSAPPEGRDGCKDCSRLNVWFDTEMKLRNSSRTLRNADSYQQRFIIDHFRRAHRDRVVASSGKWEQDLELRGTDSFDSMPADWDL